MKKLTENTFTEGLVQDLHPLTTPNNVLTDALNATLITMNGNEFVLLNDMGNGRVEKAYLPSGYVPVGIKEYGGVIYVASYNPLTNKGQIGSFPSPERNIDLEEVGATTTSISWDSFYGEEECRTFIVKTELFGGKILRSGDKFTIYFNPNDESSLDYTLKLLSNYSNSNITRNENYIESGKAISPKNNFFSIYLTVLDSNNNLKDITLQLKRFIPGENTPLEFDASILPVVKNNTGYFILTLKSVPDSKEDNSFMKERQKRAVNTYNNKLFGKIYLTVLLNIIDHINISVYGYKKKEDGTWVIPKNLNLENLKENDAVLIFDTEYVYNCPDGFTDENNKSTEVIPGYSGYYGNYKEAAIKGIQLDSNYLENPATLPFPKSNPKSIKYNIVENLYTLKLTAYLPLKIKDNDSIFDYIITPWMVYSPLNGLAVTGSINLNKLGDGTNTISTWKYYCDNNLVRITWGFNSYPGYGIRILNVVFHFYDVLYKSDEEVGSIKIDPRSSYNGSFTLNIGYEDLIQQNSLYLIVISYEESSNPDIVKYAGARWLLTNGVFNNAYFNILDFNNLVGDILSYDEVYSDNTYTDDFGTIYNRYEFIEEFKNLIRIDKLDTISYNKFDKDHIDNTSEGNIYIQEDSLLTKYLSKKNITKFKSNLKISTSPQINNNYPFKLNLDSIKYTFSTNDYKLDYDDLTIYGNEDSVVDNNSNKIFIVNKQFGTPNTYNTLSANIYENILTIECSAYSQICNYTVLGTLLINNCFKSFLGKYNFPLVFGFDLPTDSYQYPKSGFSLGTGVSSGGALTSRDEFWILPCIADLNSKNTYDFTNKDHIGLKRCGNGDVVHKLADHRDTITELIKNNLGNPVIACMICLPNYKPGNTGVYNSYGKPEGAALMKKDDRNGVDHINSILSYIIYFWKSADGLYYPVNRFSLGTSMKSFMQTFQKLYINTLAPENVQITLMKSNDLIYMEDFKAIIDINIRCKSERIKGQNLFTLKGTNLDYLKTLIKNTKDIIGDKKLVENFDKFISGVWFVTNTNYSKSILYNCSFKVLGTTYDYFDLLNLDNPIDLAVITESGKIIVLDYIGDPLIDSSIYYYDNNELKLLSKVYPALTSKLSLNTDNGSTLILVSAELAVGKYHGTKRNNYSSDHWWEWDTYRFVNFSSILNSNDYYQLT